MHGEVAPRVGAVGVASPLKDYHIQRYNPLLASSDAKEQQSDESERLIFERRAPTNPWNQSVACLLAGFPPTDMKFWKLVAKIFFSVGPELMMLNGIAGWSWTVSLWWSICSGISRSSACILMTSRTSWAVCISSGCMIWGTLHFCLPRGALYRLAQVLSTAPMANVRGASFETGFWDECALVDDGFDDVITHQLHRSNSSTRLKTCL